MAWLFAQFSMTFDPNEISSLEGKMNQLTINTATSSETDGDKAMLTLNSYFRNNEKEFDNYKEVLDSFDNDHLKSLFPSINLNELIKIFEDRIKEHQNDIVIKDQTPLTFKQFYSIFQMLRDFIENGESKFEALSDIPINHPLMQTFCNQLNVNDQYVIDSLKNFKIGEYIFNKKKDEIVKSLALSHDFMNSLANNENVRDPKPTRWQTHHMIPAEKLVTFYKYYFKLLIEKSSKMQTKFDWIKIIQYNTQKTFLVEGTKLWINFGINKDTGSTIPPPVYNFDKNPNSAQENFVKYWYKWPLGLLFYGPRSPDRSDDPKSDFEKNVANIVGQEYFEKVQELNSNILAFIAAYELNNENDELNDMAMKIYNRIVTIHREAPWDNKIIAPFNSDQWELESEKWKINTMWSIKALAQQRDLEEQQNNLVQFVSELERVQLMDPILLGAYYSYRIHQADHSHDEFKRRKRQHLKGAGDRRWTLRVPPAGSHHLYDNLLYRQKLETKCLSTTTPKPNGWCSPFYLRLNPMEYFYCKLTGHQNLHFF
jgi:hypothetical protein